MKTTAPSDFDECVRLLKLVAAGYTVPLHGMREDIHAYNVRIKKADWDAIRELVRRLERRK